MKTYTKYIMIAMVVCFFAVGCKVGPSVIKTTAIDKNGNVDKSGIVFYYGSSGKAKGTGLVTRDLIVAKNDEVIPGAGAHFSGSSYTGKIVDAFTGVLPATLNNSVAAFIVARKFKDIEGDTYSNSQNVQSDSVSDATGGKSTSGAGAFNSTNVKNKVSSLNINKNSAHSSSFSLQNQSQRQNLTNMPMMPMGGGD